MPTDRSGTRHIQVANHHARTRRHQTTRDLGADASTAAGDEHDPAGESLGTQGLRGLRAGHPIAAVDHCLEAFAHGKHVVNVTVEADASTASALISPTPTRHTAAIISPPVGSVTRRRRFTVALACIPLVVIEAKTPVRASQSWLDGAVQVHDDYEKNVPELFVPNVFSVATEGKEYRYGAVGMPVDLWGPWRLEEEDALPAMAQVEKAVGSMLRPSATILRPWAQAASITCWTRPMLLAKVATITRPGASPTSRWRLSPTVDSESV